MKRMFMVMGLFVLLFTAARAQEKKFGMYAVGFYNQENLFDTIHDEGKNDFEYLPDGAMKWNEVFLQIKEHGHGVVGDGNGQVAQCRCICHRSV